MGVISPKINESVRLIAPEKDHVEFFNRKGWRSVILHGVVDHRYLFTDVKLGRPGSVHDARVLGNSNLYTICERGSAFDQVMNHIVKYHDNQPNINI